MTFDLGVLRVATAKNYQRDIEGETEHVLYTYTIGIVVVRNWWPPRLCFKVLTIDRVCGDVGAFWVRNLDFNYQEIKESES